MDTGPDYGTDMRRSVYIEGITATDTDEQIAKFCLPFGPVNRVLRIRQTGQGSGVKALVEFESEESFTKLASSLPQYFSSVSNPSILWRVDRAYKITQTPKKTSPTVLADPPDPSDNSSSEGEPDSDDSRTPLIHRGRAKLDHTQRASPEFYSKSKDWTKIAQPAHPVTQGGPNNDILNPPEIQRVIVEHVIKSDGFSAPSQGSKWLRPFSGRIPKPPNEVDFETWSLHVELMIQDKLPADVQRRKILESLLPPASDLVRQLGPYAAPRDYVKLLDSAYGLVEDGEEIFARFLNTHQNPGEKASEFLQRLQVLLTTAIQRGGITHADANKHLLRQFQRGCWDQSLTLAFQLELKSETPPDFSNFLLQLRTEEDRRATKLDRMQRHFGSTKAKSSVNMQLVPEVPPSYDAGASALQTYISETEDLKKQVAELKMQLSKKKEQRKQKHISQANLAQETHLTKATAEIQVQQTASKPRPKAWFCFKCGNDGHIARQCENPANKVLVDQKYKELKARQDEWQTRYGHLNWTGPQWRD